MYRAIRMPSWWDDFMTKYNKIQYSSSFLFSSLLCWSWFFFTGDVNDVVVDAVVPHVKNVAVDDYVTITIVVLDDVLVVVFIACCFYRCSFKMVLLLIMVMVVLLLMLLLLDVFWFCYYGLWWCFCLSFLFKLLILTLSIAGNKIKKIKICTQNIFNNHVLIP